MKILVGLDELSEKTPPVQELLSRLDLPGSRQTLVYVLTPISSALWHVGPMLGDFEAEKNERIAFGRATRLLAAIEPGAHHKVVVGRPASAILAEADLLDANLIAVNASTRTALEALFTGSVARALATAATQSVLLARPSKSVGPIKAVFATDHSEYAEKCVAALIRLAPRGIGHLTVLTAYPERMEEIYREQIEAARPRVEESCNETLARLTGHVGTPETTFDCRIVPGRASAVIAQTMTETGADLLILGAKGHGVAERFALGSVSFEQAIGPHPYSVLILRNNH